MIEGAGPPEARQVRLVDHSARSWSSVNTRQWRSSAAAHDGRAPTDHCRIGRGRSGDQRSARLSRRRGRSGALHAGPETGEATGPPLVSRHLGEVARTRS